MKTTVLSVRHDGGGLLEGDEHFTKSVQQNKLFSKAERSKSSVKSHLAGHCQFLDKSQSTDD